MISIQSFIAQSLLFGAMSLFSLLSMANDTVLVIDNFTSPELNSLGLPRVFINDSVTGGASTTQQHIDNDILYVSGNLSPARGQLGWASSILPLSGEGEQKDAANYTGIRLLIKVNSGTLSISANSSKIVNSDYHSAYIPVAADGKFHEVNVPFNSLKRNWSGQTPLDLKTLNAISLVAFSMEKASFDFAVEEVSFY